MGIRSQLRRWLLHAFTQSVKYRTNKSGKRKVAVCYVVHPFYPVGRRFHSNILDIAGIVEAFVSLDFDVTVVDYRMRHLGGSFDVVFGFGPAFEAAANMNPNAKLIHYATGAPPQYQLQQTFAAALRLRNRAPKYTGANIDTLIRPVEGAWPRQIIFSDLLISVGGGENLRRYQEFGPALTINPIVSPSPHSSPLAVEAAEAKKFVWFGGKGCVHKGLDLCIDAFRLANRKFSVAGFEDCSTLIAIMEGANTASYLGELDRLSAPHQAILSEHCFVILPSCSEGNATSVVSMVVDRGMIPIVSPQCGIVESSDVIFIKSLSVDGVSEAIREAASLSPQNILDRSLRLQELYKHHYSKERFGGELRNAIASVAR